VRHGSRRVRWSLGQEARFDHGERMPHDWRALASIQTLAAVQYFPIVGFNNERRNHTEHDQYPRDQTSIPEESVDHEPLLSSPGWISLREKYSRQESWRLETTFRRSDTASSRPPARHSSGRRLLRYQASEGRARHRRMASRNGKSLTRCWTRRPNDVRAHRRHACAKSRRRERVQSRSQRASLGQT